MVWGPRPRSRTSTPVPPPGSCDGWGRLFAYFAARDGQANAYASSTFPYTGGNTGNGGFNDSAEMRQLLPAGAPAWNPGTSWGAFRPYKFKGDFVQPTGFQLVSAGPDGVFGITVNSGVAQYQRLDSREPRWAGRPGQLLDRRYRLRPEVTHGGTMTLTTRARATPPRPGFSLIEMLVAISITAILLALLGAELSKTTEAPAAKNSTKQQADKLQKSIDAEVDRVVKQCNTDRTNSAIPPQIVTYSDNDVNRALAVWTAMKLRQQFPDTFADANTTTHVTQNAVGALAVRVVTPTNPTLPNGETSVYRLPPLTTFADVQTTGLTAPTAANEESGVLLYIILAKKSVGGGGAMTAAADDLSQGMMRTVTVTGVPSRSTTFADAWEFHGTRRWDTSDEVQQPPYLDVTLPGPRSPRAPRPPPEFRVGGWMDPVNPTQPNVKRTQLQTAGLFFFNNRNRTAAVYSPGKDKAVDNPINSGDDIVGFRTRRYGN